MELMLLHLVVSLVGLFQCAINFIPKLLLGQETPVYVKICYALLLIMLALLSKFFHIALSLCSTHLYRFGVRELKNMCLLSPRESYRKHWLHCCSRLALILFSCIV